MLKTKGNGTLICVLRHLNGLLVHLNCWMMTIEHVLQSLHCFSVKTGVCCVVHAKLECFMWIIDIELSIERSGSLSRNKRTALMVQSTLNFEDVWTLSLKNSPILVTSQQCHGQCIVVGLNMVTKLLGNVVLA